MYRYKILLFSLLTTFFILSKPSITNADTIPEKKGTISSILSYFKNSNKVKPHKKFDVSFIGGPSYTPETKLGVGVLAAALYRTAPDTSLPFSNASLYLNASITKYYMIGIENTSILPKDRYRMYVNAYFCSMPDKFWGIGFNSSDDEDRYAEYWHLQNHIKANFQFRVSSGTFVGVSTLFNSSKATKVDDDALFAAEPYQATNFGLGAFAQYDTRDFIPNAYKGIYLRAEYLFFPTFLGNKHRINRFEVEASGYQKVWRGGIIALNAYSQVNVGTTPWSMMATLGGARQMRGYWLGQYRNRCAVTSQVELRQHIYGRSGAVAWVGAGRTGRTLNSLGSNETLLSYGFGYRWEFKHRVNIRLDFGFGKNQTGVYFNVNESF